LSHGQIALFFINKYSGRIFVAHALPFKAATKGIKIISSILDKSNYTGSLLLVLAASVIMAMRTYRPDDGGS
jgi:hypothetical protein